MQTEERYQMFKNRLLKVYKHLSKQARRQGVSCYRIYDHDLPEFPLCIELYEKRVYVAEYERHHGMTDELHERWIQATKNSISEVLNVPSEFIHARKRQRTQGRLGQYQKLDASGNEFLVKENGLNFLVNLNDYLDTGLFLDHRITRQMVRDQSAGKKVLNLFAYTGSFSVYAAAGGADEIVTVDLSNTYLDWARRNFAANGLEAATYQFVQADVIRYLESTPRNNFDIVVMDPPTFSNSKRMDGVLDIQRDHTRLINGCLETLRPGGVLFFSTNFRKFSLDTSSIRCENIRDITKATTPFDFEGKLERWCFRIEKTRHCS